VCLVVCFGVLGVADRPLDAEPRTVVSLEGPGWRLAGFAPGEGKLRKIHAESVPEAVPTEVPNNVQLAIGLKDPFGQGPELAEINRKEWWYIRSFDTPAFGPGGQARLVFDGVDYFADVWLNGELLGSHEGAYTAFSYDVTERLRSHAPNYLAVCVRAPWRVPGRSHYEFMKGEFDEWWDALPGTGQVVFPAGLHRSVRLEMTSAVRVDQLLVSTRAVREHSADLYLKVRLSNRAGAAKATINLTLKPENFQGTPVGLGSREVKFSRPGQVLEVSLSAKVPNPLLWWTWDLGPQNLYTVEASVTGPSGDLIDRTSSLFGIRTIERDANLLYRINGRPSFMRGAWYPMSKLYPGSTDRWTYEKDLRLARNANMNHLVNYTVIEKDDFYELADRLGILLFVELPFNQEGPIDALNPSYPRRDEFMDWAAVEAGQIVRALSNHPSVGVWSSVSEVTTNGESIGVSWDWRVAEAAAGYNAFVNRMGSVVAENDPDALYFRSYCDFGERHFWEGAIFDGKTYDEQFEATAPFVSEYGAIGFFAPENLARVIHTRDFEAGSPPPLSSFSLPLKASLLSNVHPWQYTGLDLLTAALGANISRRIASLNEYADASRLYQAFLYGFAGDAYRRKLFAPINGVRSWMFKSFPEKPAGGFGVIDAFDTPLPAYYVQKRTFEPVTISWSRRYALESVPAGSALELPVWVSNAGNSALRAATVESELVSLSGQVVRRTSMNLTVEARQAKTAGSTNWTAPEEAGIYVLRGSLRQGTRTLVENRDYVKIVPRITSTPVRVLVVGSPEWAQPIRDYLSNLGAEVQTVLYEATVVRPPAGFPETAAELRRLYDVVWLAGFADYWREAPEGWARTIADAVGEGTTLVHSGSMASYHGGGQSTSALELTELGGILPVQVKAVNDAVPQAVWRVGEQLNPYAMKAHLRVSATREAPPWLVAYSFAGLSPAGYHVLTPQPGSRVLLQIGDAPLLVEGSHRQGRTFAYLGFSPSGRNRAGGEPLVVDRAIAAAGENRLFAVVAASILALAAGREPAISLEAMVESRIKPLFETLLDHPAKAWPRVNVTTAPGSWNHAHLEIVNGPEYIQAFRVQLQGPEVDNGNLLALWSNQFFDLLPGEKAECDVEMIMREGVPPRPLRLIGESINRTETIEYPFAERSTPR